MTPRRLPKRQSLGSPSASLKEKSSQGGLTRKKDGPFQFERAILHLVSLALATRLSCLPAQLSWHRQRPDRHPEAPWAHCSIQARPLWRPGQLPWTHSLPQQMRSPGPRQEWSAFSSVPHVVLHEPAAVGTLLQVPLVVALDELHMAVHESDVPAALVHA